MGARILIVDDDRNVCELVAFKFESLGFAVRTAADGESAVASALDDPPDLVLLETMIPALSGFEVCRRLRREPVTADLPILMLSARTHERDVERGFAVGADDYVAKPFSPRELVSRVEAVLARRLRASR